MRPKDAVASLPAVEVNTILLGCLVQMVFSVHRTDGCRIVVAVAVGVSVAVSVAGREDCTHLPHLAMDWPG